MRLLTFYYQFLGHSSSSILTSSWEYKFYLKIMLLTPSRLHVWENCYPTKILTCPTWHRPCATGLKCVLESIFWSIKTTQFLWVFSYTLPPWIVCLQFTWFTLRENEDVEWRGEYVTQDNVHFFLVYDLYRRKHAIFNTCKCWTTIFEPNVEKTSVRFVVGQIMKGV